MLLLLLPITPLLAALLCLATSSRSAWERINLAAFGVVAGVSLKVGAEVAAQGRQFAGPVRDSHHLLFCRRRAGRRGSWRDELVGAHRSRRQAQPASNAPGLYPGPARLWHQGGLGPHAHLEARRLLRSTRACC